MLIALFVASPCIGVLHPTSRAFTLSYPLTPRSQNYTVEICVLESIIPLVRAARIGPIPPFGGFVARDMVGRDAARYMIPGQNLNMR